MDYAAFVFDYYKALNLGEECQDLTSHSVFVQCKERASVANHSEEMNRITRSDSN